MIAIDVKNAVNSTKWEAIAKARHIMRVSDYLCRIRRDYFQTQVQVYGREMGQISIRITAAVPQDSILGQTLWNGIYNGLLTLELPIGVKIALFVDDVPLTEAIDTIEV